MKPATTRTDEFYVGYLPIPDGHRTHARRTIVILIALLVTGVGLLSLSRKDAGTGQWDTGHVVSRTGVLRTHPYPMLVDPGSGEVMILVEEGKRGAQPRCEKLDGCTVTCQGYGISRDGRLVLELLPGDEGLQATSDPAPATSTIESAVPATLEGEIVDYKCYLGAMKPGEGKGHKACAILCISRGIPPILVSRRAGGPDEYVILTGPDGEAFNAAAATLAGEPVVVTGELGTLHGLRAMRVTSVTRR